MGTIDGRLVALDAKSGRELWNVTVAGARAEAGYTFTVAPLVVKDKIIAGPAGGDFGVRGFIAAFDPKTGKELWRFNTIPGPGETGHDTWAGESWKTGGSAIWTTGSYDPELNLTYWGTGNPGPDFSGDQRAGDNLYSNSVVALDPDTGRAEVALPVHAARRVRLRLDAGARARGHRVSGPDAQGDAVGEPQRLLVRPRSHERASSSPVSRSRR